MNLFSNLLLGAACAIVVGQPVWAVVSHIRARRKRATETPLVPTHVVRELDSTDITRTRKKTP
jgi:hypothetical protein